MKKGLMKAKSPLPLALALAAAVCGVSCDKGSNPEGSKDWACALPEGDAPAFSLAIGCEDDFTALASPPLDASIPGAVSLKTVVDREGGDTLYFQNSKEFQIHHEFVSARLSSANGKPPVPNLPSFNTTEYYSPNRRFLLGAVTRYEGPGIWAYEISPYDNASAEMIEKAFRKIAEACYCGDDLHFHPTSQAVAAEAAKLPASIKVISTDALYDGIEFQPLNYGTSMGRLVFTTAKKLESEYVGFRDIVVLDAVPNDISVVSGIITQEFQTPLSHINVLSQNRGTPNMGLREAYSNADLLALEGKWVKFQVGANGYSVTEVTKDEADAWWDEHKPEPVGVPNLDLETREMKDVADILDLEPPNTLGEALKKAIPAYGGKASHFAAFPHMDSAKVSYPTAFAIPVYYYWQFMEQNGFDLQIAEMLEDSLFQADPAERDKRLKALRDAMKTAPVDTAFEADMMAMVKAKFPGINRIRFRSSTNAEDLDGFTGAGLYDSKTGDLTDPSDPPLRAIRQVWAAVWLFRAFEERSYRNIPHQSVGMALLVHNAHSDEEANGVAITANPFDPSGSEPGFYINVQVGEEPVVSPESGVTPDEFIYHFDAPRQPIVMISSSTLVAAGKTVLTTEQTYALGVALKEIHRFFQPLYGKDASKWYAMDTEFKLDQPSGPDRSGKPVIIIKQARPYPGFSRQ